MQITLIAKPQLIEIPERLGKPRDDQVLGPDGQKIIELAGRVCYDSLGVGRNSEEYAKHILESGHGSVLEHANYTFLISGVSRGLTHELVRHRVGVAISQRSTRFVDENESEWIDHPLVVKYLDEHKDSVLKARIDDAKSRCQSVYRDCVELLQPWLESQGVDKFSARKQARGAARGYLGNALATELIWTANVRTLLHVIGQRANKFADAEIRKLGVGIAEIMSTQVPAYFGHITFEDSSDGIGRVALNVKRI